MQAHSTVHSTPLIDSTAVQPLGIPRETGGGSSQPGQYGGPAAAPCNDLASPGPFPLDPFHSDLQGDNEKRILTISFKMYGATPEDLPLDLFNQFLELMQRPPLELEGALRPGCVMLTLSCFMASTNDWHTSLAAFAQRLSASLLNRSPPWAAHNTDVRLPDSVIHVREGEVTGHWAHSAEGLKIADLEPLAATADEEVMLNVTGLTGAPFKVLYRLHGSCLELEIEEVEWDTDNSATVHVRMPEHRTGFGWVEVLQEDPDMMDLSAPAPLLLTDSLEVSREISAMKEMSDSFYLHEAAGLLQRMGSVLHPPQWSSPSSQDFALAASGAALRGWVFSLEKILDLASQRCPVLELLLPEGGSCNLLTAAVRSSCLDTVNMVLDLLEDEGLLSIVLQPDITGRCSLQWAALLHNPAIGQLLVDRTGMREDFSNMLYREATNAQWQAYEAALAAPQEVIRPLWCLQVLVTAQNI